jgi:uncharacterized phage protein (TIGR01671 family)
MIEIEKRIEKFRAWNQENETMDYDGGFLFDLSDFNIEHYKYLSLNMFISKIIEEFKLMRFIGAHDKQGKEIYEEDIVKWREQTKDESTRKNDDIFGVIIWNREECKFIISQITKGKWTYKVGDHLFEHDTQFYAYDGAQFNWEDLEVIGNIYQNADLYEKLKEERANVRTYL